jgi:hypothetical protein
METGKLVRGYLPITSIPPGRPGSRASTPRPNRTSTSACRTARLTASAVGSSWHVFFANDQLATRFIEEIDFDYCALDATAVLMTAGS